MNQACDSLKIDIPAATTRLWATMGLPLGVLVGYRFAGQTPFCLHH
jgi:hypothetical protein